MQPGAAIEGTVVNQAAIPRSTSSLKRNGHVRRHGWRLVTVQLARTDDRGRHRAHSLPPGEDPLTAGPDPLEPAARGADPGGAGTHVLSGHGSPGLKRARFRFRSDKRPRAWTSADSRAGRRPYRPRAGSRPGQPVTDMMVRLQRVGGPVGEVRGCQRARGRSIWFSERSGWRVLADGRGASRAGRRAAIWRDTNHGRGPATAESRRHDRERRVDHGTGRGGRRQRRDTVGLADRCV